MTAISSGKRIELPQLPDDPRITVIMPIRNEADFIERSLGAVLDQLGVEGVQVIVVDGDSDDDTPEIVREVADQRGRPVEIITNPDRIVPISLNLGLERANGDVIVRVDGHCIIAPDYLRSCIEVLRDTGDACVGGPMETIGQTSEARAIAAAQSSPIGVGGVAFRTSEDAAHVDTLAFGAYRREVFEQIGTFDEKLVRNQDDEFNLRLTRAGGRLWMDPRIRSTYFSRGTITGLWRQYHGYGFYKVAVMRKHRSVPAWRHLVPAVFVAAILTTVLNGVLRRRWRPFLVLGATYGTMVVANAASLGEDDSPASTIAIATSTMHTAYGIGFWAGIWRVPRTRQRSSSVFSRPSRQGEQR